MTNNDAMTHSAWLSWHFYPLETSDIFLNRAVRPFLEQYIWPTKGARAFYIRYEDERGPHIRLRLRGESGWVDEVLRPALETWFEGRGDRIEQPYQPEPERFGGEEALAWAEEHFHVSTRVMLDRLKHPTYSYGDALFDGLRANVIAAYAAGFDREKTTWYFGQLFEQWLPLFFRSPEPATSQEVFLSTIRETFAASFDRQKDELRATLAALWKTLEKAKLDQKQPEWLRWLRGNELILNGLGENLEKALPSLLHLTNNRLGITNQDEVFLCYILSKA